MAVEEFQDLDCDLAAVVDADRETDAAVNWPSAALAADVGA